jgi:hypothetical protein
MQSNERSIKFAQIFASICVGISCFLHFYASAVGEVEYANSEWFLFFWAFPVVIITHILSNRWLKTFQKLIFEKNIKKRLVFVF